MAESILRRKLVEPVHKAHAKHGTMRNNGIIDSSIAAHKLHRSQILASWIREANHSYQKKTKLQGISLLGMLLMKCSASNRDPGRSATKWSVVSGAKGQEHLSLVNRQHVGPPAKEVEEKPGERSSLNQTTEKAKVQNGLERKQIGECQQTQRGLDTFAMSDQAMVW
jgi:hypothetical protein